MVAGESAVEDFRVGLDLSRKVQMMGIIGHLNITSGARIHQGDSWLYLNGVRRLWGQDADAPRGNHSGRNVGGNKRV
jgi:hypothetical protein